MKVTHFTLEDITGGIWLICNQTPSIQIKKNTKKKFEFSHRKN